MKKDLTELVFILDRSSSMSGLESDTIGGFNSMLRKQKKEPGEAFVSTVLFNSHSTVIHDRVPLENVPELTGSDYTVSGCTALLDAVGDAIKHIRNVHKYARPEDVPERTVFVITTDGLENASHRYTADMVREMIEYQKRRHDWEFLFLGANIDAVETAARYGIDRQRSVTYVSDGEGTNLNYECISEAVTSVRRRESIRPEWAEPIREYAGRRK